MLSSVCDPFKNREFYGQHKMLKKDLLKNVQQERVSYGVTAIGVSCNKTVPLKNGLDEKTFIC
jgi:hypothetical protein